MAHTHKHGIYGLSRVGGHAAAAAADGDLFFFDFPGEYAGRKKLARQLGGGGGGGRHTKSSAE